MSSHSRIRCSSFRYLQCRICIVWVSYHENFFSFSSCSAPMLHLWLLVLTRNKRKRMWQLIPATPSLPNHRTDAFQWGGILWVPQFCGSCGPAPRLGSQNVIHSWVNGFSAPCGTGWLALSVPAQRMLTVIVSCSSGSAITALWHYLNVEVWLSDAPINHPNATGCHFIDCDHHRLPGWHVCASSDLHHGFYLSCVPDTLRHRSKYFFPVSHWHIKNQGCLWYSHGV